MTKREVVNSIKDYMQRVKRIPGQIEELEKDIRDLKYFISADPQARTSKINLTRGGRVNLSDVETNIHKRERARQDIKRKQAQIKALWESYHKTRDFVQNKFILNMSLATEGNILMLFYFRGLSLKEIAQKSHQSQTAIREQYTSGLLTLANLLLDLKAAGEYYKETGEYIHLTPGTKEKMRNYDLGYGYITDRERELLKPIEKKSRP